MGTRFELVLCGEEDPVRLRAAGEEALDEIERLDRQLSFYRPESDLSQVNARAALEPVRLEPRFFRLLERALFFAECTGGAFDPTVSPLMRAWGFLGARGSMAAEDVIAEARQKVGWHHVRLDQESFTVRFDRVGMALDLGAIGKGYAVEQAMGLLAETGCRNALLHGGTSTVAALGSPLGQPSWTIALADPLQPGESAARVKLSDGEALSVSGVHNKCFTAPDGTVLGHILDPRSGRPVVGARLAAVVSRSATQTDALSTALLVLGTAGGKSAESERTVPDPDSLLREGAGVWDGVSTLVVSSGGEVSRRGAAFITALE